MSRIAITAAATVVGAALLATPFHRGWTQMETDFPNYYTAAVLTLQHQPLRNFYDWTWFQRHMHYAGIDHQLGGYIPFTPLTMLHTLPLAALPPQRSKQVWMILEIFLLAACIGLIARVSRLHVAEVSLLALAAASGLGTNFLFGQDYLLLLLLFSAAAWCLTRGRPLAAGALLGCIFAIKLYAAPFALYFVVRRQWRALIGMAASVAVLGSIAVAIFGFDGVRYFAAAVLPRAVDGAVIDPYNPGFASMTAFLRHTFLREAELNPRPLMDVPALFFFLRACYVLGLLTTALLVVARKPWPEGRTFGWFVLVIFALSPNTASYHYVLLMLPIALLLGASMDESGDTVRAPAPDGRGFGGSGLYGFALPVRTVTLVVLYILVELPLRSWDAWLFPKAWLLLALVVCGAEPLPAFETWNAQRIRVAIAGSILVIAAAETVRRVHEYRTETPQTAARAVVVPAQNFASAPALAGGKLVYQTMGRGRYVLRMADGGAIRDFGFDGDVFHPTLSQAAGPIYFELAAQGHSRICVFRPGDARPETVVEAGFDAIEPALSPDGALLAFVSRGALYVRGNGELSLVVESHDTATPAFFPGGHRIAFVEGPAGHRSIRAVSLASGAVESLVEGSDSFAPAVSPDGRLLAYVKESGARQVWIRNLISGRTWKVTSGACNNDSPAWQGDSRSIVIASDCGRGLGSPGLYSIKVSDPIEGALF